MSHYSCCTWLCTVIVRSSSVYVQILESFPLTPQRSCWQIAVNAAMTIPCNERQVASIHSNRSFACLKVGIPDHALRTAQMVVDVNPKWYKVRNQTVSSNYLFHLFYKYGTLLFIVCVKLFFQKVFLASIMFPR